MKLLCCLTKAKMEVINSYNHELDSETLYELHVEDLETHLKRMSLSTKPTTNE